MATLPKSAPRAERVSTSTVDYGGLARAGADLADGVANYGAIVQKAKAEEAGRWADKTFTDLSTQLDSRAQERAATYDGKTPGLTTQVLAEADAAFQPLLDAEPDATRREAIRARFDGWRASRGNTLSQVEAAKRAEPLRQMAEAREATDLASAQVAFATDFSTRQKAREAGGLGAVTAAGYLEDFDAAGKALLDATPEDQRPRLQTWLAARRVAEFAQGQKAEAVAAEGLVAERTGQNLDTLTNTLLSNPAAYDKARALLPQLAASFADPAQRLKFESEARPALAGAFVQGLINEGQLGTASRLLDSGQLDRDLSPNAKQQFIGQLAVAARVGARRARQAANGDDGDEGDGGGLGGVTVGGPSFDNTKNGYASDPLKYAVKKGVAPVAAMDANWGLQDGAGQGQWGRVLQQRRAVGVELARADSVPQRMLTNAEKEFYQDAFSRDPQARFRVAREARVAIGPAAAQDLLNEIGVNDEAPITLMIAHIQAGGSEKFAADAQRGLSLKAQGATLTPQEKRDLEAEMAPYRVNFSATPETFLAAKQAAEAAFLADKASGVAAGPDYYALRALGGVRVNDTTYGGGTIMRRQRTVVPGWLNPDYADDALEALGEVWAKAELGPRFANGKPMTAGQIARGALKPLPNGWYQLVNDRGEPALRANGQPFTFNLDRDRQFLGKRLGGKAVLGAR